MCAEVQFYPCAGEGLYLPCILGHKIVEKSQILRPLKVSRLKHKNLLISVIVLSANALQKWCSPARDLKIDPELKPNLKQSFCNWKCVTIAYKRFKP